MTKSISSDLWAAVIVGCERAVPPIKLKQLLRS